MEGAFPKAAPRRHTRLSTESIRLRSAAPWLTVAGVVLFWQLITTLEIYPAFIIPPPLTVLERWGEVIADGSLWRHTGATLSSVVFGLVIGVGLASVIGYAIAKVPWLEASLAPVLVSIQSIPVVAYAPLLVLWFGTGISSKVFTSALIVFFPMLMTMVVGIRGVPVGQREVIRSFEASPWQTFRLLELPAALPVLMGGLKVSATLAVVGSIVSEFVASNAGLGFLINLARSQFDTPLLVATALTLTLVARLMYGLVVLCERLMLRWQRSAD